jgi:hypothetical protein
VHLGKALNWRSHQPELNRCGSLKWAFVRNSFTIPHHDVAFTVPHHDVAFAVKHHDVAFAIPHHDVAFTVPHHDVAFTVSTPKVAFAVPHHDVAFTVPTPKVAFAAPHHDVAFAVPHHNVAFAVPHHNVAFAVPHHDVVKNLFVKRRLRGCMLQGTSGELAMGSLGCYTPRIPKTVLSRPLNYLLRTLGLGHTEHACFSISVYF